MKYFCKGFVFTIVIFSLIPNNISNLDKDKYIDEKWKLLRKNHNNINRKSNHHKTRSSTILKFNKITKFTENEIANAETSDYYDYSTDDKQKFEFSNIEDYDESNEAQIEPLIPIDNENTNQSIIIGKVFIWDKWSKWSQCTRTCGGGIQIKIRHCKEKYGSESYLPSPEIDRKGCVGVYKKYKLCNDQPCSDNETARTFRDNQCAEFDKSLYFGTYYSWEGYLKDGDECELYCKVIDKNIYTTMNISVIDGTQCEKPAVYYTHLYRRRAVCVDGICKAVHSSGVIRGATTNDSLHKCGSVLCKPVSVFFDKAQLPLGGYYYLATIEIGALNISIIQVGQSENHLAIRSSDENFIINGDENELSLNGVYEYQRDFFEYDKGDDYEFVTSKGPLTKAIEILILVKGPNPGVKYEYVLPVPSNGFSDSEEMDTQWNELGMPLDTTEGNSTLEIRNKKKRKFSWKTIGFGPCNRSCGSGIRLPIFRCIRDSPTKFYTPRRCANAIKPVFADEIYQCNVQLCAPYWLIEEWSDCVCHNGNGSKHRKVKCVQEMADKVVSEVNENSCMEEKPEVRQDCDCPQQIKKRIFSQRADRSRVYSRLLGTSSNLNSGYNHSLPRRKYREDKSDKTGIWMMSEWDEKCSADCGPGLQHRSIFCDRAEPYTERCDSSLLPNTYRSCESDSKCKTGIWFTSDWSKCTGDCFNLMRKRLVLCIRENIIAEDEECELGEKPSGVQNCTLKDVDHCGPKWHYSEWTECSRSCGEGIQRRFAKCLEVDPRDNILRESTNCRYLEKQPTYGTCNIQKCQEIQSFSEAPNPLRNNQSMPCNDDLLNCHLINKVRHCKLKYYQKNCCRTCNE